MTQEKKKWLMASMSGGPFEATGGTITYSGGYTIHTFTSGGNFEVLSGSALVEYLIVGGGAGPLGFNGSNGGGGGGEVKTGSFTATTGIHTVVVGAKGNGGSNPSSAPTQGGSSSVFGQTAAGGAAMPTNGTSGGTSGNGNPGGTGSSNNGGGGGGAGGNGSNGTGTGGNGGPGVASSITGTSVNYGKGGGGYFTGTPSLPGATEYGHGQCLGSDNAKGGVVVIRYPTP